MSLDPIFQGWELGAPSPEVWKAWSVSPPLALKAVCEQWRVTLEELRHPMRREQRIATARQVAYYVLREACKLSWPKVGKMLKRDHATVINGYRVIAKRMKENIIYSSRITRLIAALQAGI